MSNTFSDRFAFSKPAVNDYNWADEFYRNTDMTDSILGGLLSPNRALSGGVCTILTDKTVSVESGSCIINNLKVSWESTQVECISGTPTLDYVSNWIYINSTGAVVITDIQPSGSICVLCIIDVSQTLAIRVVDSRVFNQGILQRTEIPEINKSILSYSAITSVFVYDTSKDSDGGAWRKRCQHLSWYNEKLNTEIRGATREFPAVALIVGRSVAGYPYITIYDATDPDLPMWMVFKSTSTSDWLYAYGVIALKALNGEIVAASRTNGTGRINFLIDAATFMVASVPGYFVGNVAQRSAGLSYHSIYSTPFGVFGNLIGNTSYCIDIFAFDWSPTDPKTGLPFPTLAIATNMGVSIVSGPAGVNSIVDLTCSEVGYIVSNFVAFREDGAVMMSFDYGTDARAIWVVQTIPSVDTVVTASHTAKGTANEFYGVGSTDLATLPAPAASAFKGGKGGAFGNISGLTIFKPNPGAPASGGVAHVTKTYNSGWMLGATKGNWLCDGTVKPNLITNGFFEDGLTGWSVYMSYVSATASEDGIKLTQVDASNKGYIYQSFPTEIGKTYEVKLDLHYGGATVYTSVHIGNYAGDSSILNGPNILAANVYSYTFTAVGTTTWVAIILESYTVVGNSVYIGSVTAKEVSKLGVDTTTELVTNGTFSTDLSGWSLDVGTITVESGRAKLVNTGSPTRLLQSISTVAGGVYQLNVNIQDAASATQGVISVKDGIGTVGTVLADVRSTTGVATDFTVTFKALSSNTTIYFGDNSSTPGDTTYVDNVSVKRIQNIVENGEFSSDRAWTKNTGWTIASGVATKAAGTASTIVQANSVVPGKTYLCVWTISSYTAGGARVYVGNANFGALRSAAGTYTDIVVSDGTGFAVYGDATFAGSIDNVTLYELDVTDRAVSAINGRVIGQLTQTPVAPDSEMTWLSGFNANNYIEIPFSSAHDYNTGDFFIMAWCTFPNSSASKCIWDSRQPGGSATGPGVAFYISSNEALTVIVGTTSIGTSTLRVDMPAHVCFVRKAGVGTLYVNGTRAGGPTACTGDASSGYPIRIGVDYAQAVEFSGPLSMIRTGAYAPTEEQIAFMYEQERPLFMPRAKCLLSDTAVVDIAYDSVEEVFHACTALGLDTFSKLRNVNKGGGIIAAAANCKLASAHNGKVLLATSTAAEAKIPAYSIIEELERKDIQLSKSLAQPVTKVYTGAGKTSIALPVGFYPIQLFDAGVMEAFTVTFDGFIHTAVLGAASSGDVTILMRRV